MDRRSGRSAVPVAMHQGERAHWKLWVRARERYDVCAAERPSEGSTIASLRPMMEQDVELSAVSAVVDVSSADGRQLCSSNGWQRTLEYGPLNSAGSGQQPWGIRYENQPSVARCNQRNRTNRRSRLCVGLERAVICTAPWKAWQTTERGLRLSTLSRTLHARSSRIIVNFLTIAWEAQMLAIGDSICKVI
jgi:hypothetical protein